MTLIQTEDGKNILIDCRIRDGKEHPDVRSQLRENFLVMTKAVSLFISLFGRTLIQIIAMEYLITSIWGNLKIE